MPTYLVIFRFYIWIRITVTNFINVSVSVIETSTYRSRARPEIWAQLGVRCILSSFTESALSVNDLNEFQTNLNVHV